MTTGTKILSALWLAACFAGSSSAADVREIGSEKVDFRVLVLEGQIEKGDYAKVRVAVLSSLKPISWLALASVGGDVVEAIRIGRLVRMVNLHTVARGCSSACVLVWVAGVERSAAAELGLHRPYFDKSYFSGLSKTEADARYSELSNRVKRYLEEMEVPREAIELIFATSSSDIVFVGERKNLPLYAKLAARSPAYDEWLRAKCGKFPVDAEELNRIMHLRSTLPKDRQDAIIERYAPYHGCMETAQTSAVLEGLARARQSAD
jgi:hypothetical protein